MNKLKNISKNILYQKYQDENLNWNSRALYFDLKYVDKEFLELFFNRINFCCLFNYCKLSKNAALFYLDKIDEMIANLNSNSYNRIDQTFNTLLFMRIKNNLETFKKNMLYLNNDIEINKRFKLATKKISNKLDKNIEN